MSLWDIFQGFLEDALNAALNDILSALEGVMGDLLYASFFIETLPGLDDTVLSVSSINAATDVLYGFMILLLAGKLIWKGIKVYILWRDGESETPPGEMAIGSVFAVLTAVLFPTLYKIGVEIVQEMITAIGKAMFSDVTLWNLNFFQLIRDAYLGISSPTLIITILGLVYILLFIWLMFVMLKQGVEMLVFRLGVPIAVIGLVDSDGGAWKPYSQTLFRQMATALVRYLCMFIGVRLIVGLTATGLIVGIAFEIVAISTPTILSQFLSPKGGGGMSQKVQTVAMAVRMFGGA